MNGKFKFFILLVGVVSGVLFMATMSSWWIKYEYPGIVLRYETTRTVISDTNNIENSGPNRILAKSVSALETDAILSTGTEGSKGRDIHSEKYIEINREQEKLPKLVILNGYMRSGSTYLGSVIGHHDNVFYFFEPLHKLMPWGYVNGSDVCDTTQPTCIDNPQMRNTSLQKIEDILNCKLTPYANNMTNINVDQTLGGPKWNKYQHCMTTPSNTKEDCIRVMETECKKMNIRIIKVLRMSLNDVTILLDSIPNLKIIHLFRDPRSVINSHFQTNWYKSKVATEYKLILDAKASCRRFSDDIKTAFRLVKNNRVKLVHYEDTYDSISKKEALFEFIGMKYKAGLKLNKTEREFGTTKQIAPSASFARAFKYRGLLPYKTIQIIQKHCTEALTLLGLRVFSSEEQYHNANVSAVVKQLSFSDVDSEMV